MTPRTRLLTAIVLGAMIVLGLAVRITVYAAKAPLTLDEAMLALNVARRGALALMRPLSFEQSAPIGFLWLARAAVRIGGVGELTLRVTPLLAGLMFAPVVAVAARWLISVRAAAVAGVLALLCPLDIQYAATFKQYALDATITACVVVAALAVVRHPAARWAWVGWVACCLIAPLISASSVFVTLMACIALGLSPIGRTHRARIVGIAGAWLVVAGATYWRFQRATVSDGYMQRYWAGAFLQPPLHDAVALIRARSGFMMEEILLGDAHAYPAVWRLALLGVMLIGWWWVGRRSGAWAAVLLAGPCAAVAGAAVIHVYPLSDRTLLFLAPLCILGVVAGAEAVAALTPARWRSVAFAAVACWLAVPPAADAVALLRRRQPEDNGRILRETTAMVWRQHVQNGEPVYIFSRSLPVWTFYTTDWSHPDLRRVDSLESLASALGPNSGNAPERSRGVSREGDAFTYRGELVGIATGMEDVLAGPHKRVPDPGWATNEATRIRAVASPTAWAYFTYCHDHCERRLLDTLLSGGGQATDRVTAPSVQVFRFVALSPKRSP